MKSKDMHGIIKSVQRQIRLSEAAYPGTDNQGEIGAMKRMDVLIAGGSALDIMAVMPCV